MEFATKTLTDSVSKQTLVQIFSMQTSYSYSTEFLERNPAVAISVGVDDRLVDNLLQLCVLQVVSDHHFQDLKQLAVRDVPVAVHVIDLEGNYTHIKFIHHCTGDAMCRASDSITET